MLKLLCSVLLLSLLSEQLVEAKLSQPRPKPKPKQKATEAPTYPNYNVNEYWLVGTRDSVCRMPSFSTIQDAVDSAQAGDTILVCPGTYAGALVDKELHFAPFLNGHGSENNSKKKKTHSSKAKPKPKSKDTEANTTDSLLPTGSPFDEDSNDDATADTWEEQSNSTSNSTSPTTVASSTTAPAPETTTGLPTNSTTTTTSAGKQKSKSTVEPTSNNTVRPKRKPTPKPKPKSKGKMDESQSESELENAVIIVSGPTQNTGGLNQDGFSFVDGASGSSLESFVFLCTVPSTVDDANMTRAISLYQVSNVTITNNLIFAPRVGVYMETVSASFITNNRIVNVTDSIESGGYGIVLTATSGQSSSSNQLLSNFISFPAQPLGAYPVGIFLSAPGPAQRTGPLTDNTVSGNRIYFMEQVGSFFGILLFDNAFERAIENNDLLNNYVEGSEFGIVLWGASENTVQGNTISGILFVGIRLQKSQSQKCVSNMIISNTVDLTEFGIACVAGAEQNMIARNTVTNSNSQCDLYDAGAMNVFTDNIGIRCSATNVLYQTNFEKKHPPHPR